MLLPSYEEANRRGEVWEFVASWVTSHEKTVLCRVSRHFHTIFSASLWSEPTRALLSAPDAITRLDAFIENAPNVRKDLRDLVVTIDLRGLRNNHVAKGLTDLQNFKSLDHSNGWVIWLRKLNVEFPSLKFILFDGNPSFDLDVSLPNISTRSDSAQGIDRTATSSGSKFSPILDDSPWDHNSTAYGMISSARPTTPLNLTSPLHAKPLLLSAVDSRYFIRSRNFLQQNVENLVFLDISGTLAPPGGLRTLGPIEGIWLPSLRVLKMRRLNLSDLDLDWILGHIGEQLFSLDVRDNKLTSTSTSDIIPLITHIPRINRQRTYRQPCRAEYFFEDTPSYVQYESEYDHAGEEDWEFTTRQDDADGVMNHLKQEASISLGSLQSHMLGRDSQMTKKTGLTHLYISGNRLTARDIWSILSQTGRLQVADFGSGPQDIQRSELSRISTTLQGPNLRFVCQLGTQEAVKIDTSRRLQELRVHHSLVTLTPTIQSVGDFYQSEATGIKLSETLCGAFFATNPGKAYVAFLPQMNPRLRELTLTDVPRRSSGLVVAQLTNFIREASLLEQELASHKPTQYRHRRAPRMLSGLRLLRLEFVPLPAQATEGAVSYSSVTGDSDADNFLAESSNDFSFFDAPPAPVRRGGSVSKAKVEEFLDVRDQLAAYRRETASALERQRVLLGAVAVSDVPPGAPHFHWTGVLELVG